MEKVYYFDIARYHKNNYSPRVFLLIFILSSLCFISTCASTARLYNVNNGEVIELQFENLGTGHGKILGKLSNGESIKGEYSTVADSSIGWGQGSAFVTGSRGYGWATAQGFSFNEPNKQYGSATLVGGGLVIEIVYVTSLNSHGYGVGRDNKGGKYRVQF